MENVLLVLAVLGAGMLGYVWGQFSQVIEGVVRMELGRARQQRALKQHCPYCSAKPGTPCRDRRHGIELVSPHLSREPGRPSVGPQLPEAR